MNNVNSSFERVEDFKYLGTALTNQNSIQEESKSSLNSGNACYYSVHNVVSFSVLSTNLKVRYTVVSLTMGSWALFPVVTENLRAHSRAVTCCPEDGRLTLKVGGSSLKSYSPRQSPNTDGLVITIWYKEVAQLLGGVQENSYFLCVPSQLRSAWSGYCQKYPPISEAQSLVILKSATLFYHTLLLSSPYSTAHKKHKAYINCLFLIVWED